MAPIRRGDGTGLNPQGYTEVRKGDGTVLWSSDTDSEILRYEFENDYTDSWNENDGTGHGTNFTEYSKRGDYALVFDGTDDWLEYPTVDVTTPNKEWCVAFWGYFEDLPISDVENEDYLWHPRGEYDYAIRILGESSDFTEVGTEPVFTSFSDDTHVLNTDVSLNADQWYFIGASHDGSENYTMWVDDDKYTDSLPDPESTDDVNQVYAQSAESLDRGYTHGSLAQFSLYDKDLTDTEWDNLRTTGSIDG